ncbi:uncharacterized protein EI97DRAFT_434847 [Westerdykella ornata]|uniref:Chalcone isomerase domain-containing protein n=1 Tax=Westerdykella ornata TaxID=318751 RepID=A0A6A6JEF0_WESOR|nr:uncharacterized protein EI97DRAFT_434847 [Westerdykella ornata]KAF2274941.1 hypothetical protein EI97DRAFT_434847 [Westerdykella ornata]
MISARLGGARRPLLRTLNLNAPSPRRNFRLPSDPPPKTRVEPESRLAKSFREGTLGVDVDAINLHRAQAVRRHKVLQRRKKLIFLAFCSFIAPFILSRVFWPHVYEERDRKRKQDLEEAEKKIAAGEVPKSRGVIDLIWPKPVNNDSSRVAAEEFQGKKVVVAPGDKIIAAPKDAEHPTATDAEAVELVETGTSYVPYFPRTIEIPTSSGPGGVESKAEYTLLGLGVRKVSFLRVQVYVVGLYVKTSSLSTLQNHLINTVNPNASALIPGEKDDLRQALLDANRSNEIWESILTQRGANGVEMALRIVPTRGTDFNHLRDGLMRGIMSRTDEVSRRQAELRRQQAAESKTIAPPTPVQESEFSDENFGLAMKDFKALFGGRGSAPKGSVLLLTRDRYGALEMLYQPLKKTNKGEKLGELSRLGSVYDARLSRLLWLLYLGGQNVSSEEARKSIVDGCIGLVERPVGTVEAMVQ